MTEYKSMECKSSFTLESKADTSAVTLRYYTKRNWWLIIAIISACTATNFIDFWVLGKYGLIIALVINIILFWLGNFAITKRSLIKVNGNPIKFNK